MGESLLQGFPEAAPPKPKENLIYADVSHSQSISNTSIPCSHCTSQSTNLFPSLVGFAKSQILIHATQVAVTATAKEFAGIYRGKQYHMPDFTGVLDRASSARVDRILLTGMSRSDIASNANIAKSRPQQCSITIGVHPYHASEPYADGSDGIEYFAAMAEEIDELLLSDEELVAAYGELGLDYDHLAFADKETQVRCFKDQLDLYITNDWRLPLFLHCRAAYDDFVAVMEEYAGRLPRGGLVHSFVGTTSQMQHLVSLGLDVSVNGFSFKDRESLEMVAAIPLQNLHLETDAPWGIIQANSEVAKRYLVNAEALPQSKKKDKWQEGAMVKERNESCCIAQVAFIVAGLQGQKVEEVAKAAWDNSRSMFWP